MKRESESYCMKQSQDFWEKAKKQHLGSTPKTAKTTKIKLKQVPLVYLVLTKFNEEIKQ